MFTQSKNWTITDFELLSWNEIYKASDAIRYICVGKEICPTTKKKHYQGWIQTIKTHRLGGIKKLCRSKKVSLRSCRGTELQNDKYCKKDGLYKTYGEFITQGKRTDLDELRKIIDKGGTLKNIADENFQAFIQYNRGFQEYKKIIDKQLRKDFRKVEVIHIYGETGLGKTRKAMEYPNIYKIQGDHLKWWDGYDGEETILIDDYDDQVPITELLCILDGYQLRLPIKCSFTYANWTKVIITSNIKKLHSNAKTCHVRFY